MTSRLNPYLHFQDDAGPAMKFYEQVFGGTLTMNTFGDFGQADSPDKDKIMHAQLETAGGLTLMGSDTPSHLAYEPGSRISVSLSGTDGDELRGYWEKLTDGATVTVPLEKQMWGDEFGMLTDRFGIEWLVNISQGS
jgi:PhnB protein